MGKQRWIIVANSSIARFFRMVTLHDLEEVKTLIHAESRLHGKDITTDRPGRTSEITGFRHSALETEVDPKKQEALIFAKQVSETLEFIRNQNGAERFYLAANPSFLGLIRQSLSPQAASLIEIEISKDITHLNPADIPKYFVF